jgi:hypothetical protein
MLLGSIYFGVKMLLLATSIRNKNSDLIGRTWNGRLSARQMQKLLIVTNEDSRKDIQEFLFYSKLVKIIVIGGFAALFLVAALNSSNR